MTDAADRELRASLEIPAAPDAVWALVTDFDAMTQWSPELVKMLPLKRGGLRLGQWYLGINRRGWAVWPTRNVVAILEPGRLLGWDTTSSGARWIYEVMPQDGGTRLTLTRPVPTRLTLISRLFAPVALGGSENHADELEAGMARTLAGIAAAL